MNQEDLASDPSSSNPMNVNYLSWFLNIIKGNLRISRGGRLLMGGITKGHETT